MAAMALASLIDETEDRNGWRDTTVAKRASDAGLRLTTSDISLYRLRGMKQIVPSKIVALARGLELPPYRVALAVLADLGIDVPVDMRSPERAIQFDETLSAHARRTLLVLIEQDRQQQSS